MKRKYQVFISSTFSDLADHRRQAMLGIINAGHLPLALEYKGLEASTKIEVIRTAIADCQFYVVILGHRYGTVDTGQAPGQEKSYVELELNYAQQIPGMKVIALVMDKDLARDQRNQLKRPDDVDEISHEKEYQSLRDRLTRGVGGPFYKPFLSPNDVFTELYAYFSKEYPEVKGYIPEPLAEEDADILRISAGNELVREAIQRLGQFKFVDPRLSVAKNKKIALARAFCQLHGDHIRDKWRKVFIESGSTLAYVAKELCGKLPKMGESRVDRKTDRRVITNNSLAYLYLWLCSGVLCHPEPEGPPDVKYGGMYGALTERDRVPDYHLPPLMEYDKDAVSLIEETSSTIFGDSTQNEHSILLAAASAIQLSDHITATDPQDPAKPETDAEVLRQLSKCRGFHGGSYQNRLFKLCMFLTKIPAFVFIHDDKIDCAIRVGVCHFLCDTGYTWEKFIGEYPLSIWVACDRKGLTGVREGMATHLNLGDWRVGVYADATDTPIVIAHNAPFRNACHKIGVSLYEESS